MCVCLCARACNCVWSGGLSSSYVVAPRKVYINIYIVLIFQIVSSSFLRNHNLPTVRRTKHTVRCSHSSHVSATHVVVPSLHSRSLRHAVPKSSTWHGFRREYTTRDSYSGHVANAPSSQRHSLVIRNIIITLIRYLSHIVLSGLFHY